MEKLKVRDLMTPVGEFPQLAAGATFYEALQALEEAQGKYLAGESKQRILLVADAAGRIIGKISPIDLLRGLETNYQRVDAEKSLRRFGLNYVWEAMQKEYQLWENPFRDLCRKAAGVHIGDFIKPSAEQSVGVDDNLMKCFNLFVMNRHDALFVLEGTEIVGLLRFTDVFKRVSQTMKACAL